MSFTKTSTPQPLNVMPDLCETCKVNKAEVNTNGMFLCRLCLEKQTQPAEAPKPDEKPDTIS